MLSLENFKSINIENWSHNARFWIEHVNEEENRARLLYDIFTDKINKIVFINDSTRKNKETLIVDMGCGEGSFIRKCVEKNVNSKYIGVDICEPFIKWAQERDSRNTYLIGDIEKEVPIDNGVADVVVSLLSLIEVVDLSKAISEMVRIVSKDGHVLICILHPLFDIIRLHDNAHEKAQLTEKYLSSVVVPIKKKIKIKDKTFNRHYFRIHHNLNKYFEIFDKHKLIVKEYNEFHLLADLDEKIVKPVFIFMHLTR